MIQKLNINNPETAQALLDVQILSYNIEAKLIQFDGIPQLADTVESIQASDEIFYGYFIAEHLVGAISYKMIEQIVDIHRLIVDPDHFRKGIGKSLVEFVINKIARNNRIIVSTGAKNIPAKQLYKSIGFFEIRDVEVAPNVFITMLEKNF